MKAPRIEGDVTADEEHGGMSEKFEGLRNRAKNRGHRDPSSRKSAIVKHAQSREYKTGLIGFVQRVGTVSLILCKALSRC